MKITKLENILSDLEGVKRIGATKYMAICPAHSDKVPSLSIGVSDDNQKILLHCFDGCDYQSIIRAIDSKTAYLCILLSFNILKGTPI